MRAQNLSGSVLNFHKFVNYFIATFVVLGNILSNIIHMYRAANVYVSTYIVSVSMVLGKWFICTHIEKGICFRKD